MFKCNKCNRNYNCLYKNFTPKRKLVGNERRKRENYKNPCTKCITKQRLLTKSIIAVNSEFIRKSNSLIKKLSWSFKNDYNWMDSGERLFLNIQKGVKTPNKVLFINSNEL